LASSTGSLGSSFSPAFRFFVDTFFRTSSESELSTSLSADEFDESLFDVELLEELSELPVKVSTLASIVFSNENKL
jgi:hypothetical protein